MPVKTTTFRKVAQKKDSMFNSILKNIFGCSHRTTSFPLTPSRKIAGRSNTSIGNRHSTYVVCLDCGKEFGYDWNAMRIMDAVAKLPAPVQASLSPANQ
jgi:hypothetical protein